MNIQMNGPVAFGWLWSVSGRVEHDDAVTGELFILCIVVVTALAFDFTNGFHDTANAMATSVATGALKPKAAVILSAVLNLVGAFLSIEVALTVSNKIISIQGPDGAPVPGLTGEPLLIIIWPVWSVGSCGIW